MATQQEIDAVVRGKLKFATQYAANMEDEPDPNLIKLLGSYYYGGLYEVRDLAFALLADRFSMSQILQVAPERYETIEYLTDAIFRLPVGNRRAQFFSDLLEVVWMESYDRSILSDRIEKGANTEIEILAERYRRSIKFDKDFVIDLGEFQKLPKFKNFAFFEDIDHNRLSVMLKPCAISQRKDNNSSLSNGLQHFGRQRNIFTSYLLRHPDPDMRYFGAALADMKNPDIRQELADVLAREIDNSVASVCARGLKDTPRLLADSLAICPIGPAIAYRLGRDYDRSILPLTNMPTAIQLNYQLGREERILDDFRHMDRYMRDGDIREFVGLLRGVAPTLSAIYSGIPRVLQDAVGSVTGLTPPNELFLELTPAPQIRFLAKLVPKQSHRELTGLLTHSESLDGAIAQEEKREQLRDDIAVIRLRVVQEARNRWRKLAGELRDSIPHRDSREDPYIELFPELNIGERSMLSNIEQAGQVRSLWARYREHQLEIPGENWERVVGLLPPDIPLAAEGVLGTYNPVDHRIIVYSGMISLFARYIKCEPIALRTIALIHECAHAVLIHGADRDNVWWSEFSKTSTDLHEILATVITERTAETLAGPELVDLAQHVANRSLYSSAVALLRGSNLNDLLQLVASIRNGFLNGDRKAMLSALARLLSNKLPGSLKKGSLEVEAIRKLVARSGAAQTAEKMLEHALLRWWCIKPGPNPNQSLRLDLDALERAIERIGQNPPDPQVGLGLWPVLRSQSDFTTELFSMMPVSDAMHKKVTKEHETVSS